jgi:hypothetical protein
MENMAVVFEKESAAPVSTAEMKDLDARIGQLTLENEFFSTCVRQRPTPKRKAMIEGDSGLSIRRQCVLLDLPRSSLYHEVK